MFNSANHSYEEGIAKKIVTKNLAIYLEIVRKTLKID